jgi:hypothetical protein
MITDNAARNMNYVLCPFLTELTEEEKLYGIFHISSYGICMFVKTVEDFW